MDRIGSPLFVEIICGPALTVSNAVQERCSTVQHREMAEENNVNIMRDRLAEQQTKHWYKARLVVTIFLNFFNVQGSCACV